MGRIIDGYAELLSTTESGRKLMKFSLTFFVCSVAYCLGNIVGMLIGLHYF